MSAGPRGTAVAPPPPPRTVDGVDALPRIPVAGPSITARESALAAEAATTGWQERAGHYQSTFERAFADWVGRRHAIALPSCTAGLHLALAALGIGPGDEVIVPELTWIATAAPIRYLGATPVFADVDPATWGLCPRAVERAVTPRTRAVLPVDLYGSMPDLEAIERCAAAHGIALIEDAAQAIGGAVGSRRAGSFGLAGVFSFHGSKTLTTGEGGMLVTDDDELLARCLVLRDHGRQPGDTWFRNECVGFKYRMSAVQAALGLAQLERVEELIAGKRRLLECYRDRLNDLPLQFNPEPAGTARGAWMSTIVVDRHVGLDARSIVSGLDREGIDSRPFFHPLSAIPAFADHHQAGDAAARPHAYDLSPRGVNLPSGLQLDDASIDRVARAVRTVVEESISGRR